MGKEKDPAFLFYSKDWIEGTAEMMPTEKGIYIDLLCYQHQRGSLPSEIPRLAKMVGLSEEAFTEIWKTVSSKFDRTVDRMVNRKLEKIMNDRKEKGKQNTVIGTFAGVLRKLDISKREYGILKSGFIVAEFANEDTERLTERLTEWCTKRLKSIANENEIGNAITIEERKEQFKNNISAFIELHPSERLNAFFSYWTEKNEDGKKMRFEMEKVFEIKKRLNTFKNNETKFNGNKKQPAPTAKFVTLGEPYNPRG